MMFRSAFRDLEVRLDDQFACDDRVASRFTLLEIHNGELTALQPTGKRISVSGISIIRFKDGKAVEEWIEEDGLGLMRQLGVIPVAWDPLRQAMEHLASRKRRILNSIS